MANVPDIGGDAGSNIVVGTGTDTVTYTMPSAPGQKVTSVVATVDNSAGPAITPKVVIRDSSGQVIATNRQADSIPAGDTGTASFSLRLSANGSGERAIRFDNDNQGGGLYVQTNDAFNVAGTADPWSLGGSWGYALEDDSGQGAAVVSTALMLLGSFDQVTLIASSGGAQSRIDIFRAGGIEIKPFAGSSVSFVDRFGAPKVQWTEGDVDLHIPAGGAVVADL